MKLVSGDKELKDLNDRERLLYHGAYLRGCVSAISHILGDIGPLKECNDLNMIRKRIIELEKSF